MRGKPVNKNSNKTVCRSLFCGQAYYRSIYIEFARTTVILLTAQTTLCNIVENSSIHTANARLEPSTWIDATIASNQQTIMTFRCQSEKKWRNQVVFSGDFSISLRTQPINTNQDNVLALLIIRLTFTEVFLSASDVIVTSMLNLISLAVFRLLQL